MMTSSEIAAHVGIQELYSRYCFTYDRDDVDGFADCFTHDGVFAVGPREFSGEELGPIASRHGRPRHQYLNLWIRDVDGDAARSSAYFFVTERATGATVGYGDYEDWVRRCEDGRWRFVRREVHFLWQTPEERALVAQVIGEPA